MNLLGDFDDQQDVSIHVDTKFVMIFLNVAADSGILQSNPASTQRLMNILTFLAPCLSDNGTLVLPLENFVYDHAHLKGKQKSSSCDIHSTAVGICYCRRV